jgi:hypothetical protein
LTQLKLPDALAFTMANVRSVLPSAFLAGGALRDLDNGRPVKDYDVFYTETIEDLDAFEFALMGTYRYLKGCPGEYMDAAKEVMGTVTFHSLDGHPELNLIQLDESFKPATIIERVDFGLCQIGADANGVITTEAYEHDKLNRCFTLTRAETVDGVRRSLKRYDRLSVKYPGWQLFWKTEHDAIVREAMLSDSITSTF